MRIKKGKKVIIFLLIVIALLLFYPRASISIEPDEVSYISILSSHHPRVELHWETDADLMQDLIERTNRMVLLQEFSLFQRGGFRYAVTFVGRDQNMASFSIISNIKYSIEDQIGFPLRRGMDEAYLESLLETVDARREITSENGAD